MNHCGVIDGHGHCNANGLHSANKQFDFEFYLERNDNHDRLNKVYDVWFLPEHILLDALSSRAVESCRFSSSSSSCWLPVVSSFFDNEFLENMLIIRRNKRTTPLSVL